MATTSVPGLEALLAEIGLGPIPFFAAANVLDNFIDLYHSYLVEHFHALVDCNPNIVYDSIQPSNTTENGDLDIVLPKLKLPGASPKKLAGELTKKIRPHPLFLLPFKDGVHLRFFFSPKVLPRLLLPYINDRKSKYGTDPSHGVRDGPGSGRKKVLVEFSSPNIGTDFTVAHLRSTLLGAFVANIYEAMGWDVVRINYLGDWGEHLGLLSLGWQKYGSEKALNEETSFFRYIHNLYTKIADEIQPEHEARKKARYEGQDTTILETQGLLAERDATFKRMEEGEPDAVAMWKTLRGISIEYYVENYARLNIKFDEYSGESEVSIKPEAIAAVESMLKDRSICEEQDGASIINYDKHEKRLGTGILRGRNGSTRYQLRDIATVFDRFKTHSFDKMIYVVCEQDVHFRQIFKAVELMGHPDIAKKLEHVTFPRAGGSSSALGNAHLLGDILDQCENQMHEFMGTNLDHEEDDAVEKTMGINSLLVQQLSSRNAHGNGLSFKTMTSWEGETGPNLQLCYGRLCSAIASIGAHPTMEEIPHIDYSSLWEGPWCELLRMMARYPDVTNSAFRTPEPSTILSYAFRVVEELTNCLDEAEEEESEGEGSTAGSKYVARGVLYENVRQVLENAMKLLGITLISS